MLKTFQITFGSIEVSDEVFQPLFNAFFLLMAGYIIAYSMKKCLPRKIRYIKYIVVFTGIYFSVLYYALGLPDFDKWKKGGKKK